MAKTTRSTAGRAKRNTAKTASQTTTQPQTPEVDELDAIERLEAEAEQLEALAAAAAQAAQEAKAAYIARQTSAKSSAPQSGAAQAGATQAGTGAASSGANPEFDGNYLDMLSRVFNDMSNSDWDPNKFDDMTQGLGMVLGSGPAFAALGSMLANSTAQGSVLVNATQMQRQLDQVGLCTTSACVKQLLSISGQDHDAG